MTISRLDRLLRRSEVQNLTGMSCSAIYAKMQRNEFPRPRRIGNGPNGAVAWLQSDIESWMAGLPMATPAETAHRARQ